jgi:hypothetical protein
MGEQNRTIIVHISDDASQPNGLRFGMSGFGVEPRQMDGKTDFEIKCGKDKAGMQKKDPHKITFEINNRSSRNWVFPTNVQNAMWVGDATTCPKTAPGEHTEFKWKDYKRLQDGEQLEVKNQNSSKGDYKFSLNFIDADGNPNELYPFDPIWTNQNGGGGSR